MLNYTPKSDVNAIERLLFNQKSFFGENFLENPSRRLNIIPIFLENALKIQWFFLNFNNIFKNISDSSKKNQF